MRRSKYGPAQSWDAHLWGPVPTVRERRRENVRLTKEQLETAHKTRLGHWNGKTWILAGSDVYSETPDGLRYEGSYAWFSVAAADRLSRGDTDKSIPHALDCDLGEDCTCGETLSAMYGGEIEGRMPIGWPRRVRPGTDR